MASAYEAKFEEGVRPFLQEGEEVLASVGIRVCVLSASSYAFLYIFFILCLESTHYRIRLPESSRS